MEQSGDLAAPDAVEDETTVPTGPWEEDENEDCPAYHTAAFRMYVMKILPCFKRYCHDWTICPFAHPGEKARRRDPRTVKYSGIACPEMKKAGACRRGSSCPYAHTVFEYWLHPNRYRTQMCKDGTSCQRRVCFFAHTSDELRPSGSKSSTQEGVAGSSAGDYQEVGSGSAQDQGSPRSTGSPGGLPLCAPDPPEPKQPRGAKAGAGNPSISSEESQSISDQLSLGSLGRTSTGSSSGVQRKDAKLVSVSEVNNAMTSLKAAMTDGTADRNHVIDMLSTLLRGSESSSLAEEADGSARVALPDVLATRPGIAGSSRAQGAPRQRNVPPAQPKRGGAAEVAPRHRKMRAVQSQQPLSGPAASSRLAPAALQSGRRGGPPELRPPLPVADLDPNVATTATLMEAARAIQQLQGLQASQGWHQQAAPQQLPPRQLSADSLPPAWAGGSHSSLEEVRQASWASAPDLALHAKEAAQRIGAHLPTFPESEDSDELSERMRLLSMSHCQGMESLLQQQFQQRPQQLSSSGPASRGLQDLQYALSSSYGLPPLSMGPDLAHAHTAGGYLPLQAAVPRQSYQGLGEARAPPQAPLQQFHSVPNHVGAQQQEQHWSNAMNRLLHEAPQAGMAGADVLAMRSLSEGMPPSHPHRGLPYSLSSDQHMLLQEMPSALTAFAEAAGQSLQAPGDAQQQMYLPNVQAAQMGLPASARQPRHHTGLFPHEHRVTGQESLHSDLTGAVPNFSWRYGA